MAAGAPDSTAGLAWNATPRPAASIIGKSFAPSPVAIVADRGMSLLEAISFSAKNLEVLSRIGSATLPVSKPSAINEIAFARATDAIAASTRQLLAELNTTAPQRDREVEAAKAKARAAKRYAPRLSVTD